MRGAMKYGFPDVSAEPRIRLHPLQQQFEIARWQIQVEVELLQIVVEFIGLRQFPGLHKKGLYYAGPNAPATADFAHDVQLADMACGNGSFPGSRSYRR